MHVTHKLSIEQASALRWRSQQLSIQFPSVRLTIDACNLRYLFQGRTKAGSSYDLNECSLGLLTPAQ